MAERWQPPGERALIFVVAEPVTALDSTLGDLLLLEIIVTGSILLAAGAAAWFLVHLGLRPLRDMAKTAGEIAAGNLSRRVDDTDQRTEVGQLGSALNLMLSRIEQAFRDKELSEQRLRRFIADASHELRTPLTSIRGYAELFRRVREPEGDLSQALRRIEGESTRMSGLVEDLLLLARLDQGRPLDASPVNLVSVCEDVASDARLLAPDRTITVAGSGDVVALGDEARLRQVVTNLVSNAISHTPEASPVEISLATAGGLVELRVSDHGPGIDPADRVRVFDRFWRADESRQRSHGGSGLGLSIVAAVVGSHGGRVFVDDTPGGGATFVVELPRAVGHLAQARREDAEAATNIRS
jgi:two-component system OmpR family sensor kinase